MTELSNREIAALQAALDDEYHAYTTYDQVIADFGEIRPFINIRTSEARHIDALLELFDHYSVPPPENRWHGKVKRYRRVRDACADAIEAEIGNADLYDRLETSTTRGDLNAVFAALRDASQHRHLPAFQRCLHRTTRATGGSQHES